MWYPRVKVERVGIRFHAAANVRNAAARESPEAESLPLVGLTQMSTMLDGAPMLYALPSGKVKSESSASVPGGLGVGEEGVGVGVGVGEEGVGEGTGRGLVVAGEGGGRGRGRGLLGGGGLLLGRRLFCIALFECEFS